MCVGVCVGVSRHGVAVCSWNVAVAGVLALSTYVGVSIKYWVLASSTYVGSLMTVSGTVKRCASQHELDHQTCICDTHRHAYLEWLLILMSSLIRLLILMSSLIRLLILMSSLITIGSPLAHTQIRQLLSCIYSHKGVCTFVHGRPTLHT